MISLRAKPALSTVPSVRSGRVAVLPAPVRLAAVVSRRAVVARAEKDVEDTMAQVQENVDKAVTWVQTQWQSTEDHEKPAAVAILIGAFVAQVSIVATINAVDQIPILSDFFQFVGIAVSGVYGYKYLTDPSEREKVKKLVQEFTSKVTGK